MKTRWLLQTLVVSMLAIPPVKAEMPIGMFGMMGMTGMMGMSGMGMTPNSSIVELIAGNMRNTRGWYEQRSNGQLVLYPIFPLQPIIPMLPLSPSSNMVSMSNLSAAMAAGMSPPQGYVFIISQGWYTVDINGVLALHPTSASVSSTPPPSGHKRADEEDMTTGSMGGGNTTMGMMGVP
jgi:hypothetical protein